MRIAVFGLGYVGSVTAACLAANGHQVCGVDTDPSKVDAIRQGHSPVVEPGLEELIRDAVAGGTLSATTKAVEAIDRADVSLVCVGTPSTARGGTDLTHVRGAVTDIARAARVVTPGSAGFLSVVLRSTIPPGTVEEVVAPKLAAQLSGSGVEVGTAMCPEFLREGSGIPDFYSPPFVVVGTGDDRVAAAVTELFAFLDQQIHVTEVRSAEALKYACNAFHATKISFANEMGRLFRLYGVNSRQVMTLFCEDSRLNISPMYLKPGFAFGGSCLPKDLRSMLYLARMNSADMPLLAGTLASNQLIISEVVDRIAAGTGRDVALLGLSFKKATDDLRESPNVELAERLLGKGFNLRIFDSVVNPAMLVGANRRHVESRLPHLRRLLSDSPQEALMGADIALVSSADSAVSGALLADPPGRTIDLCGGLGEAVEALPGYEGVAW